MYNSSNRQNSISNNDIIVLLKKTINCLQNYHHVHEGQIRSAQHLSLEGEKRRHRYFACKMHDMVINKICKVYDVYGIDIWYDENETKHATYKNAYEYFTETLKMFEAEYLELHSIANSLVVANAKTFSICLYDLACEIEKECIIELRRYIKRAENMDKGVITHDIAIYQNSWEKDANTHDKFEIKES